MIVEILRNSVSLEFANELCLCVCCSCSWAGAGAGNVSQSPSAPPAQPAPAVVFDTSANNKFSAFVEGGGRLGHSHSQRHPGDVVIPASPADCAALAALTHFVDGFRAWALPQLRNSEQILYNFIGINHAASWKTLVYFPIFL